MVAQTPFDIIPSTKLLITIVCKSNANIFFTFSYLILKSILMPLIQLLNYGVHSLNNNFVVYIVLVHIYFMVLLGNIIKTTFLLKMHFIRCKYILFWYNNLTNIMKILDHMYLPTYIQSKIKTVGQYNWT